MTQQEFNRRISEMNRMRPIDMFPEFHQAMREALKEIREIRKKKLK